METRTKHPASEVNLSLHESKTLIAIEEGASKQKHHLTLKGFRALNAALVQIAKTSSATPVRKDYEGSTFTVQAENENFRIKITPRNPCLRAMDILASPWTMAGLERLANAMDPEIEPLDWCFSMAII
ncbi:MAG: hypothetical protein WC763_02350 [Candidatus Paceibacterota bacterium]|jgi:hypothetical protein